MKAVYNAPPRVDFESTQTVEVCGPKDTYQETEFVIGLTCSASSSPGNYNHHDGGWPPEGAEFELATISVNVLHVNSKVETPMWEAALVLTWTQFRAVVGLECAEAMYDEAVEEAHESGEF